MGGDYDHHGGGRSHHSNHHRHSTSTSGTWWWWSLRPFLLPSLALVWQYIKIWIYYPLLSLKEHVLGVPSVVQRQQRYRLRQHASEQISWFVSQYVPLSLSRYSTYMSSYVSKYWRLYAPSLQMMIPLGTLGFMLWYYWFQDEVASSQGDNAHHALTMQSYVSSNGDTKTVLPGSTIDLEGGPPHGAYQRLDPPSWTQVLYFLATMGTVPCIIIYGRVIPPIPDLVAGSSVLKAIRNGGKSSGSSSSGLWGLLAFFGMGGVSSSKFEKDGCRI